MAYLDMTLSDRTKIEWKVVCWLLAAAVSWGVIYERVDNIAAKQEEMATKQEAQGRELSEIKTYIMRGNGVSVKSP